MAFDPRRLRTGEWLAGIAAVAMLVLLFAVTWAGSPSRTGWEAASVTRWVVLVAALTALALALAQGTRRSPALPACLSVIATVVGLVAVVWVLVRVALDAPDHQTAGAWLELLATVLALLGSFLSLREEGILERDGPEAIEHVELPHEGARGPSRDPAPGAA